MESTSTLAPVREIFGLFAIIESRRVVLPLKGVECEFTVQGGVIEVSLSQIFRQDNPKPLDCRYLFPLPGDASVYSCEADINGRIIRAQIKERQEARQMAAEKKAAGFRTALVESERDNLFTLELGNVQPEDLVIVRLKYFQTLRNLGDIKSIEIPFCPGVRYIPGNPLLRNNTGKGVIDDTDQVPDASRITPVRIDALHPDAAYIDVRGRLDARFLNQVTLKSPSHGIDAAVQDGVVQVTLDRRDEVPDRDFVLRWEELRAEAVAPRAWLRQAGAEHFALMEIRAPQTVAAHGDGQDFYFLVDRSGSMNGLKWKKAVEALQSCVSVLGAGSRVMVTLFSSGVQDFAEKPLPASALLTDNQFRNLEKVGANGGTEMAPALRHVLEIYQRHSAGRPCNLILITDAQIGNDEAILEIMQTVPGMPVHCFGIDIALNDALLLALARQQGGTFHSLNPNDDIPTLVTKLGNVLGQPVLTGLCLSGDWETANVAIPNLYAGQTIYVSAKSSAATPLVLTGRTPAGETFSLNFEARESAPDAPRLHWCRERIQRLLVEKREAEAIKLSVDSNLLCRATAFIAWDEAEKVTVANHELVQPSQMLCELTADAPAPAAAGAAKLSKGLFRKRAPAGAFLGSIMETLESLQNKIAHESVSEGSLDYELSSEALRDLSVAHSEQISPAFEGFLYSTCRRIDGNALRQLPASIMRKLANVPPQDHPLVIAALEQLLDRLGLCADLVDALTRTGDRLRLELHAWRLKFRMLLQKHKFSAKDEDWDKISAAAEQINEASSPEQLTALTNQIRDYAKNLLQRFADELPAQP